MVNIGRPSTGCLTCKSRHIKCDETRPSCRRCQMIRRVCPGYPDPWDTIFHDETKSTRQKTLGLRQTANNSAGQQSTLATPHLPPTTLTFIAPSVLHRQPRAPSLEDSSIECMLHGWSKLQVPLHRDGWLDLVIPAYTSSPEASPIRSAFNALALCWFWKSSGMRQLAEPAYQYYARAIRSTYAAILDPKRMKDDGTLLSILMLASFESLDCSDPHGAAYRKHIEGAIRLAEIRGQAQFENESSLRLFRAARWCFVTQQLIKSQPVTNTNGFNWFPKFELPTNHFNEITMLGGRVADLRAECSKSFNQQDPVNSADIDLLISTSNAILHDLQRWREVEPTQIHHTSILHPGHTSQSTDERSIWNGLTYIYDNYFDACVDGQYHTLCLYTSAVMLRSRSWQKSGSDPDYNDFTTLEEFTRIQKSVDEICYIVPYSLDQMPDRRKEFVKDPYELSDAARRYNYTMLSAIVTALGMEGLQESQREWLKGRLLVLGQKLGLEICNRLAMTPPHVIFQTNNPYRSGRK